MKRTWRFIKWFYSKCGWFELVLFTTSFCFFAGFTAGEGPTRDTFWTIAIGAVVGAMLMFLWWGAKNMWDNFKKHDEQVFDILKKDNIK